MHIPDGYVGPPTYAAGFAACAGLLWFSARKVKANLDSKKAPLLALSAAFSFLIMMFNIPIPGGTTGHAVGAVLIAIVIGPWAAGLAVTIALAIQALLFGDGGITALGLNTVALAYAMPCSGYWTFRGLKKVLRGAKGNAIAAGIGAWVGLNIAALIIGIIFGIQPLLHTDSSGHALYAPYPLSVAVPAMLGGHLLIFGVVEALVTGFAILYLRDAYTNEN